jgi:tight adherence protein B
MTLRSPLFMLLSGFAGLVGVGIGSMLMLRVHTRKEQLRARFGRAIEPHLRNRTDDPPSRIRQGGGLDAMRVLARVARLFGVDAERPDLYPMSWWLVLMLALVAARVLAGLGTTVLGPWAYLLVVPAWVWLSRTFFRWCERRRSETLLRQLPDALATMVRSVRAGIPVGEAIRLLAREGPMPTAREFKRLSDQIAMGVPLPEALVKLSGQNMLPEYRFFATTLSLQSQTGGGLAETLENLADVSRKRVAVKDRGRALASEANASATVLSVMPVLTGLALWVLNPDYIAILFVDPGGQRVLALALFLLGTGIGSMRYLIHKALS